ncbi:hypothetical protein ACWEQ2_36840 [Streptomyces sp. NPDC004096]|uniref:hypothetical protein n=1 Tax=Streptomyces sp. HUAS TT11 TaxID=3447508 RepID=UPI003F66013D
MPEEFTFAHNIGSIGYRVLDRQDKNTSYGMVWHDPYCCKWVAEYPGCRHSGRGLYRADDLTA